MHPDKTMGHLLALLTIGLWGATFVSTKLLLAEFRPVEILFIRFIIGVLALYAVCPRRLRLLRPGQELAMAAAGLCGICLYYLLENIALTYTMASHVGVLISVAPFFTALLSRWLMPSEERLQATFFIGFAVAMVGVCLMCLSSGKLELRPVGDVLALLAALVWACYSVLVRRISSWGIPTLLTTRRVFGYGLLCMLPVVGVSDFAPSFSRLAEPRYLLNMLYLGLGASALCFVTWNLAVKRLGAVKTSAYIYMTPVVTLVTSALILHEPLTWSVGSGIGLTLAGLFLSEWKGHSACAQKSRRAS